MVVDGNSSARGNINFYMQERRVIVSRVRDGKFKVYRGTSRYDCSSMTRTRSICFESYCFRERDSMIAASN